MGHVVRVPSVRQGQLGWRSTRRGFKPNLDVTGASYLNFLTYSDAWFNEQTDAQRHAFRATLRIQRTPMNEPSYSGGYIGWLTEATELCALRSRAGSSNGE